ncbi:ATP-binding cassette domain-containing protein [Halopseudomonas pachastrellae]|nr:ATP-binding cassette domain-containing protein [Halopseudomonas pachastrellae]
MTDTQSISATRPMIELSDVTVRYGGNVVALDNTTLRIDKGDFVALVGPSGCGKSTILKLVAGLLEPTAGAAIVGGREVGAIGSHAKRLGLAFQNPTMLPWLSILDNVMIPLKIVEPFRQDYRRKRKGGSANAPRLCWSRSVWPASATSGPGSCPAACCSAPLCAGAGA